jgi:hypothetical protein
MQLTREQVNTIIKNAPAGTNKYQLLDGLIMRGYNLEGVDSVTRRKQLQSQQTQQTTTKTTPEVKEKSVIEKVGDFTGLTALGKGAGLTAFRMSKEGKELEEKIRNGTANKYEMEAFQNIYKEAPTTKEVLGSALSTATMFAPVASASAPLLGKVAAGAATGYAYDVAGNLGKNKEGTDILKAGTSTAVGAVLPVLGTIIGKSLKDAPKKLEEASLRLSPTEKRNLAKQGKDIAQFISDNKISGTPVERYDKIEKLYTKTEEKIGKIVKGSKETFNRNEIIEDIMGVPQQYVSEGKVVDYDNSLGTVEKMIETIKKNYPEELTAEQANNIKRNLMSNAFSKNNTDIINSTLYNIGTILNEKLRSKIGGLEGINKEYGLIIASKRALKNAQYRPEIGLVGKIAGSGFGTAIGSAFGAVGSAVGFAAGGKVAEKALGTTTRSNAGKAISNVNSLIEALSAIPEKELNARLGKLKIDKVGNLQITKKLLLEILGRSD